MSLILHLLHNKKENNPLSSNHPQNK